MSRHQNATKLWAIGPYQFKTLPNNTCLVIRTDTGAVSVIDARWKPFLTLFQPFRTLQQHTADLVARNVALKPHEQTVYNVLERLRKDGVFVSGSALVERLSEAPATAAVRQAPLRIAVTTCDRPQQLDRLLHSLVENERTYGNSWRYEIVDDSRRADAIDQNKALIAARASQLDLQYHGLAERRAFLGRLLERMPEAANHLRWLVDSADAAHENQATYGCPKNYLMLRYAGERLILIDDDAVMRGWRPAGGSDGIRFGHAGLSRRIASDISSLKAGLVCAPGDPIGEQARLLGAPLADAIALAGDAPSGADLLGQVTAAEVARLDGADSTIRATMSAVLGDPGTWSDISLLYQDRDVLSLAEDPAAYRSLLAATRCVYNGEGSWVLSSQGNFQLATMAGIDLTGYLPPVMPSGRGEDTMVAVLLESLYPGDVTLISPTALEHLPTPARYWRPSPDQLAGQLTAAAAFCTWARMPLVGESRADPHTKLAYIKSHFQELEASDTGQRRLREALNAATKRQWSHIYGEIARVHASRRTRRTGLADDASKALLSLQRLLTMPAVVDAEESRQLIAQNARYFGALDAWEAARAMVVSQRPAFTG